GNVFDGFKVCFVQLMLAGAVSQLLTQLGWALCVLPGAYLAVAWAFALPLVADKRLEFWSAMELSRKVVTRVWFSMFVLMVVTFLPFLLFQVFVGVKMGWFIYGLLQQAHFDLMQLANVFGQHSAELIKLGVKMALLSQVVLALNMFFAVGVLLQAYETLFGSRTPSAP
ncbi:MAG TPA: hypothetical protein VNT26_08440, partial [Candidatus Sulfotelmatobacter sp.]|nr:hypothetical protein [Candidatus Sulfotelmatobacter sp.]